MSFIDALSIFCNVSILAANTITFVILAFGAIRVPRFYAFWVLLAAYPFFILLSALNLLTTFGKDVVLLFLPKEIFKAIYPALLTAAPMGCLLSVVGIFLVVRYIIKKESQK